jgi:hypothetical protein
MSDSTPNPVSFPLPTGNSKKPLPEIVAEHYGFPLAYHDVDGDRYYAVQDWIRGVSQSADPGTLLVLMKRRAKKFGFELLSSGKKLPYLATNGKTYQMDFGTAESLYLITQRMDANTGLRNNVLQFLAKSGVVIDEMRIDPEKALDAAIEAYRRQGKSEAWIQTRIMGKVQRLYFTSAFKKSLRTAPSQWQYALITDEMRLGVWKRSTATIREQMGLKKSDNLRDHQSALALNYEMLAENMSAYELEQKRDLTFDQSKQVVRSSSEFIGKQADDASRRLGIDIATNSPLLNG